MATEPTRKISKSDRKAVVDGLMMLHSSLTRAAKAAKSDAIRVANEQEAIRVHALANSIATGELDL